MKKRCTVSKSCPEAETTKRSSSDNNDGKEVEASAAERIIKEDVMRDIREFVMLWCMRLGFCTVL